MSGCHSGESLGGLLKGLSFPLLSSSLECRVVVVAAALVVFPRDEQFTGPSVIGGGSVITVQTGQERRVGCSWTVFRQDGPVPVGGGGGGGMFFLVGSLRRQCHGRRHGTALRHARVVVVIVGMIMVIAILVVIVVVVITSATAVVVVIVVMDGFLASPTCCPKET